MYGFQYGKDYPRRIIDHEEASKKARDILWRVKNEKKTKKFGKKIVDKHTNHSRSWR
jgi:deoxyribodipyrimidine photo-lyase